MFINIRVSFLIFLLFIGYSSIGQNKCSESLFSGLYFGGQSYGEASDPIGFYFFNRDSTFIFIKTELYPDRKTKEFRDRFGDTLIGFGKGNWYVKDDQVLIKFKAIADENIQNGKLKYTGYSKAPFDSLFLNITVTNYDVNTLGIASIIFPEKNLGATTDTLGSSRVALYRSSNLEEISVSKFGYLDMKITLPKNYNVHEYSITLAKSDNSTLELVPKYDYSVKFHCENRVLIFDGKLKKQAEGKEKVTQLIKNSYYKFPTQKSLLNKILKELE